MLLICKLTKLEFHHQGFPEDFSADALDKTSSVMIWQVNR